MTGRQQMAREDLRYGVQARIRPLRRGEFPAGGTVDDTRMVHYFIAMGKNTVHPDLVTSSGYRPLEERELLTTVMHVFGREQSPSDNEVVAFYRRYGPVAGAAVVAGALVPAWAERLQLADRDELPPEVMRFACEPVWWVREQARELRLTYDLYRALREADLASLRSLLGGVPEGKQVVDVHIVQGRLFRDVADSLPPSAAGKESTPAQQAAELTPLSALDCRVWAATLIARQLNRAEAGVRRTWEMVWPTYPIPPEIQPEGEPESERLDVLPVWRSDGLVPAIYLQLGELVKRRELLRQCPGCDRLFYAGRANRQYCSAACGDATRQRIYYRRPGRVRQQPRAEGDS